MDFTVADALAYLRTDQSDLHDRLCADVIERLQALLQLETGALESLCNDLDSARCIESLQREIVTLKQCLYDEQYGITAELDITREFGTEPRGCPTPGMCSCPDTQPGDAP